MADNYDDDDLNDYLSDDQPTPEEEDQIEALLPVVKKEVPTAPDDAIREALWQNYIEVERTVTELKKKFKEVKVSKMALLARQRAQQREAKETGQTNSSILDRLKNKSADGKKSDEVSSLKRTLKRPIPFKKNSPTPSTQAPKSAEQLTVPTNIPIFHQFDVSFDQSPFVTTPKHDIFPQVKRQRLSRDLYSVYLPTNIEAVKANFKKASPDDIKAPAKQEKPKESPKPDVNPITEKLSTLKLTAPTAHVRTSIKPSISLIQIGHVDAGKSTLTGRLLLNHSAIAQSTFQKLHREATKSNKASFSLAWVMDSTPEERNRGVTIDSCASAFETENVVFNIVDSPGHRDFIPNMISGITSTDVALLVVDASTDAFESGFSMDGQTKEHALLVRAMGVGKVVVVVNKMDNVDWDEARFEEIKGQLQLFLTEEVGYPSSDVDFVPVSAFSGLNVSTVPANEKHKLEWYQGQPLVPTLECIAKNLQKSDSSIQLILSITDAIITGSSLQITGRVHSGAVSVGQVVHLTPTSQIATVDSIYTNETTAGSAMSSVGASSPGLGNAVQVACSGDFVTLKLKGLDPTEVRKGDLVTSFVPPVTKKLLVRLSLFAVTRPVLVGSKLMMFCGESEREVTLSSILEIIEADGTEKKKKKVPRHLKSNQVSLVEIELNDTRGIPGIKFGEDSGEDRGLGRVVVRRDGVTLGAGVIEGI